MKIGVIKKSLCACVRAIAGSIDGDDAKARFCACLVPYLRTVHSPPPHTHIILSAWSICSFAKEIKIKAKYFSYKNTWEKLANLLINDMLQRHQQIALALERQ